MAPSHIGHLPTDVNGWLTVAVLVPATLFHIPLLEELSVDTRRFHQAQVGPIPCTSTRARTILALRSRILAAFKGVSPVTSAEVLPHLRGCHAKKRPTL
eukprot:1160686-Pelagomonas_calceolata.AAC.1